MRYALSAFSITVSIILIMTAVFQQMQKSYRERDGVKKIDPQDRASRIKRLLKTGSNAVFPSRGPASLGQLIPDETRGAWAALQGASRIQAKALGEHIEELEESWGDASDAQEQTSATERAALLRLCKENFAFACERFYHHEKSRYFEALEKARSLMPGPERERDLARLKKVRSSLDRFARSKCLGGNPYVCQDVVDQPGDGELMDIIKSYCLGGGIDYCMTAGFALLNRWSRGQKQSPSLLLRSPQQEIVLDEAKTFMAKGCQAGSFEACSELIQGPLANVTDARTTAAIEFFDGLCSEGDPAACVAVAGALYNGNRQEIADAVQHYCELRARPTESQLSDEERAVCARLARDKSVDEALWAQMLGLMYEGPRLSARVLDHLAPGRNIAAP